MCMYQKCVCFDLSYFIKPKLEPLLNLFKTENFNVMFLNSGDSVLIQCNFGIISIETDGTIFAKYNLSTPKGI